MSVEGVRVEGFHGMVGHSRAMRQVFEQIVRLASSNAAVLLVGETGTGKELAARAIHQAGPRQAHPFVAINCATLPRDLIDSELFGHKRGAFSGAITDHLGLFRAADGGTLFLDEITEMGLDLQAKLLRVLQERAVRPVGALLELPIDVRVVASTNLDLGVTALPLRRDLFFRICACSIRLPPLRERREDVPVLVRSYLARTNEGRGQAIDGVAEDAMEWLCAQPWSGNVRELFNLLEAAASFSAGPQIDRTVLTTLRCGMTACSKAHGLAIDARPPADESDFLTLRETERALVRRALQRAGGNKVRASRLLGISRKTLYKKLVPRG